jgi:hypothetical protein
LSRPASRERVSARRSRVAAVHSSAEVGIEFAKEVLKAVYQYSDLLNRLRALKATTT